ncbi:uncharacterized protein LOC135681088 isoform X2 [Rhopilema esculentum]|uniref:uncharacterized protein LOC135681088 isoform X2 n=1 Tax=Rhopilema esculentum TaxID=499914 RepID=UPI0031D8836D
MPRRKKQAVTASSDLQSTWELHYVSYFLRVFKKLFHLKKAYTAEILEKELSYEAIHVQFGEEVAKIVEYLTGEKELGATSWEPVLEEQMCKDAIHPNILKGTNFNALDPEQRLQLLKIVVDLIRDVKQGDISDFGKNLKSKSLRFKAVGKDKDENKYWTFGSSRLFREFSKPHSKRFEAVCTTPNEWEGFILTLRPSPHKNERELHKSLKHVWGKIKDHMQLAQLKMKGQLELSQMAVKEHFELKRQAEAIEALESNLEKPKMTNIDNVKKPTKQKINDGFTSPVLPNNRVLPNGPEKGMFVKKKKIKPKLKKEIDSVRPVKPKAKISRSDSSSSSNEEPVTKKPKLNNQKKSKTVDSPKKEEDDPPISEELRRKIEMDDPGIDLSVFKPLGKRKCVLELEERKGKTWYEADDDASEEELQEDQYAKPVESGSKKKKRKKPEAPPVIPAEPPVVNPVPLPPYKSYVFSTALANRGAYEVLIKGKYNTILEYHQAQKWPKPYLQHRIHCEPFVPEELKTESIFNSPDSGPGHSLSEDEEKMLKKVPKKKPRKKVQRKISDASISASTSSPGSVATRESLELRSEKEIYSSGRDTGNSDHESSGSERDHDPWAKDVFSSKRDKSRVDRSHIFKDDLKREHTMKEWNKMPKFGMETQDYDEYHKYLYNNNRKTGHEPKTFSPSKKANYSAPKKLQNSKIPTKGQKKQNFSNPRPSPLNQPTKVQLIPDQLSEDDDDEEDEEESETSENEELNGDCDKEEKEDQFVPRTPPEAEIEDAKSPTEQLMERHISPAVSKLQAADTQNKDTENGVQKDPSRSTSPPSRLTQQAASVISNNKSTPVPSHISTPSDALSGSPRNSPQLSPFASYRGRPATYPAEIVNLKSATVSSPRRSMEKDRYSDMESARVPENNMRSPDDVIEIPHNEGSNSSMHRPPVVPLGSRASPPQQAHPSMPVPDSKRPKPNHLPQMSPHPNEVSSVIQRPNPSPSSSVDNLCSPAIPMHQMQSPSIPLKPPSSSPIVIHDTVNGNMRSVSPTSPASVSTAPIHFSSGVHSVISPVITNHIHKSPPVSRSSPGMQGGSNAGLSCAVQRAISPSQTNNALQRMQAIHASQAEHASIQAALYQRHRISQLPASLKTGVRGTPSILDDAKRIPAMVYNQQQRTYQPMPHSLPKELSHRAFSQTAQEAGHTFHGISPHSSQETPRSVHAPPHGVPDALKSHLTMARSTPGDSSRTLLSLAHNNEEQARTYLGVSHGVPEAARSHHGLPRGAQSSPRSHISMPNHSQDASRTILGLTQSAQEVARNVLGSSHVPQESSSRVHHSAPHTGQESSRSHHGLPINAQEISRSHHPFAHPMHDQSRYPPGMAHPFHHGLNRTLHESPHTRSLHEVTHPVRPGVHGHSFQQGFRSLNESPVGKRPPTLSLFQHAHGREFPSPSTDSKAYPSPLMERALTEQQSRILEHQQQVRLMEQQQSKKSFSVESLTSSSDASERSKGQCLNGQPNTASALSRAGYSASQRSHMFGHIPGYPRGPSSDFLKLPAHVQQMYSARGLSPYMNFPHFKG